MAGADAVAGTTCCGPQSVDFVARTAICEPGDCGIMFSIQFSFLFDQKSFVYVNYDFLMPRPQGGLQVL